MANYKIYRIIIFIFSAVIAASFPIIVSTAPSDNHKTSLAQLNREIVQLNGMLEKEEKQKKQLLVTLNQQTKSLNSLYKKIKNLESQYEAQHLKYTGLQAHYQKQNNQLKNQHKQLTQLLKLTYFASYASERSEMLPYYHYLYLVHGKKAYILHNQLESLYQTIHQLEKKNKAIQANLKKYEQHRQQFKQKKQQYQQLFENSDQRVQSYEKKLQHLIKNKEALEKLVSRLTKDSQTFSQKQINTFPTIKDQIKAIPTTKKLSQLAKEKGRLFWPIKGKIIKHYGTPMLPSDIKITGVFMEINHMQSVRAIYKGKVVFADRLRGLGYLIVVEHGQGDLSLYGHNQKLLKKLGDVVQQGERIAMTMDPKENIPFYFEIRHAGEPINPVRWCIHP